MTALKRIEREPLWDLAHTQLQDALLAGRFEPGTVLTLRSLAESFGTSITPVRDAVTRLVAQGVLQQGPRNSAIVPHLSRRELADLTVVRCALEGRAAREAAAHRDEAALRRLQERLTTMQSLIQRESSRAISNITASFISGFTRCPASRCWWRPSRTCGCAAARCCPS